jgi:hypothetical protein
MPSRDSVLFLGFASTLSEIRLDFSTMKDVVRPRLKDSHNVRRFVLDGGALDLDANHTQFSLSDAMR